VKEKIGSIFSKHFRVYRENGKLETFCNRDDHNRKEKEEKLTMR
jgi:hypothetical protein